MIDDTLPMRKRIRLQPDVYATAGRIFSVTLGTSPRRSVFSDLTFGAECVELLGGTARSLGVRLFAYCLMPDHVHLLLDVSPRAPLPRAIGAWKSLCFRAWRKRGGNGSFWQRGYYDHALRAEESVYTSARYIVENPVRANLVKVHRQYPLCGSFELDLNSLFTP